MRGVSFPHPSTRFTVGCILALAAATALLAPAASAGHVGADHYLKVHGNARWDLDGDGAATEDPTDLGDRTEFDGQGDDAFTSVRLEPAYRNETAFQGSGHNNVLTDATLRYHPTYWAPSDRTRGDATGLFDTDGDDALDHDLIYDEEYDASLDDDNLSDPIDLLGVDDNVPDFATWNDDVNDGDVYFPALVQTFEFSAYQDDHDRTTFDSGDAPLPTSGHGGQVGLNSYSVGPADSLVRFRATVDGGDASQEYVQVDTWEIRLELGETLRFLDHQVQLEAVHDNGTATFRVQWLPGYGTARDVGPDVDLAEGELLTVGPGSRQTFANCDASHRPAPGDAGSSTARPWFLCLTSVDPQNDTILASAGRLLMERADETGLANPDANENASEILVNGAYYHVDELDFGPSGGLESFSLAQVVPLGRNVTLTRENVTLVGHPNETALPFLPPFERDHEAVEQHDLEADRDSYGFLSENDGGSPPGIQAGDLDLVSGDDSLADRLYNSSARHVSWKLEARETGLQAHRQTPDVGNGTWTTAFNAGFPTRYVSLDLDEPALVDPGPFEAQPGMKRFLWDGTSKEPVHFQNGARLFSQDLRGDDGDRLLPNPAVQTTTGSTAGGSDANVLVSPAFSYDAHALFDEVDHDGSAGDTPAEDPDGIPDLNVLADEESNSGFESADDDTELHTVDADGDNLFDLEQVQNNDDEGDISAPALRHEYTYRLLEVGSYDPRPAPVPNSSNFTSADSATKLRMPVATDSHDGEGLDSCSVGGDTACEETLIQYWDDSGSTNTTKPGTGLLRLESEKVTLDIGDRGQFLDFEIEVESTDTQSYSNGRARLAIYHVDEAGSTNDEVGSGISGVPPDTFVGATYDYESGSTSLEGEQASLDANGDGIADLDWYTYIDTISSNSVTLSVGRFLPHDVPFYVDGQPYRLDDVRAVDGEGNREDAGTPTTGQATAIESLTLATRTPVGPTHVDLVTPSIEINAIQQGDALPTLPPFDRDHKVADNTKPVLEQDVYGAFDRTQDPDGDDTKNHLSDRLLDAPALGVTVAETGELAGQTFLWADGRSGQVRANGIFRGSNATTGGAVDGTPAIHEGQPGLAPDASHGGYPDPGAANTPARSHHQGTFLETDDGTVTDLGNAAFPGPVLDDHDRGYDRYARLQVNSGQGGYILESARLAARGAHAGAPGPNVVHWNTTGECETSDAIDPCITPAQPAKGWYVVPHGDVTGLLVGDGTGATDEPEQEAEPGLDHFAAVDIACDATTIDEGETVGCDVTVTNTGSRNGTQDVVLTATDPGGTTTIVDSQEVTLEPNETVTVPLEWTTTTDTEAGDWTLQGVTEDDRTETVTVEVRLADAPDLTIPAVEPVPAEPRTGDEVRFNVTVENVGTEASPETTVRATLPDHDFAANATVPALSVGEVVNVTVPPSDEGGWPAEPGDQHLAATVDPDDGVPERNEDNNTHETTFHVDAPDLTIPDVEPVPAEPRTGDEVRFNVTVENVGAAESPSTKVTVTLPDQGFEGNATIGNLRAGDATTVTVPSPDQAGWTAEAGTHDLAATVDPADEVAEQNDDNNTHLTSLRVDAVDLAARDIAPTIEDPKTGDEVRFNVTVANEGAVATPETTVLVRLPEDGFNATATVPSLDPTETRNVTVPSGPNATGWTAEAGTHPVDAVVDPDDEVPEENETNNDHRTHVSVGAVDLAVEQLRVWPEDPEEGDEVRIVVEVGNRGNVSTPATEALLAVDPGGFGNFFAQRMPVDALDPGESDFAWIDWEAEAGNATAIADVDPDDDLDEEDEDNNWATERFHVEPLPDLVPTNLTPVPDEPLEGEATEFRLDIRNRGSADAPRTLVRFRLDGEVLDEVVAPPVAAGDTVTVTSSRWNATVNTTDGNGTVHAVRATVDADDQVHEIDDWRNSASAEFLVEARPDPAVGSVQAPTLAEGEEGRFTANVSNQGHDGTSNATVRFLVDGDALGAVSLPQLAPGERATVESPAWTADEEGDHRVRAVVAPGHPDGQVRASNDEASEPFRVRDPDLAAIEAEVEVGVGDRSAGVGASAEGGCTPSLAACDDLQEPGPPSGDADTSVDGDEPGLEAHQDVLADDADAGLNASLPGTGAPGEAPPSEVSRDNHATVALWEGTQVVYTDEGALGLAPGEAGAAGLP